MTSQARLAWIHRGPGDHLWLRIHTSGPGELELRSGDEVLRLADLATAGVHDVTVSLTSTLGSHAPTTWELALGTGSGVIPVAAERGATASLSVVRVLADGRAADVRVQTSDAGATRLVVVERAAWGEVLAHGLDGTEASWTVSVAGAHRDPGRAVLVAREGDIRHEVALGRSGDDLRVVVDLAALEPRAEERTYDLWLETGDDRLRVGRHLDDLSNKGRSVVPERVEITANGARWTAAMRFTDRNNVSVTVEPRSTSTSDDPLAGWELDHATAKTELGDDPDGRADQAHLGHRTVAAIARLAAAVLATTRGRPRAPSDTTRSGRAIHLLIATIHATGGTIRATVNTANGLATDYRNAVTLTSVYRILEELPYPVADRVDQRVLVDLPWLSTHRTGGFRAAVQRFALRVPSVLIHPDDPRFHRFSLWTDVQLYRWVRSIRSGTIVTTRAGLSIVATRFARPGVTVIAQQHVPYTSQTPALQRALAKAYRRSQAVCVLTSVDEAEVREAVGDAPSRVVRVPNALFDVVPREPDLDARRIVCGGRLTPAKGIDLLVEAFAEVAPDRPGWEVRVYGSARADRLAAVREMVRRAGLTDSFHLVAPTDRFDLELAKASICVVPSRHEAFGMVIIEAMRCGVPVVAFDCPTGPREIITAGVDGVLVPPEDPTALAVALRDLTADPGRRRRLAAAGRRTAEQYLPERVAGQLVRLIDETAEAGQRIGGRP